MTYGVANYTLLYSKQLSNITKIYTGKKCLWPDAESVSMEQKRRTRLGGFCNNLQQVLSNPNKIKVFWSKKNEGPK